MVSSALTHQTDSVLFGESTPIPCATFKLDWAALWVLFTLDFSISPWKPLTPLTCQRRAEDGKTLVACGDRLAQPWWRVSEAASARGKRRKTRRSRLVIRGWDWKHLGLQELTYGKSGNFGKLQLQTSPVVLDVRKPIRCFSVGRTLLNCRGETGSDCLFR